MCSGSVDVTDYRLSNCLDGDGRRGQAAEASTPSLRRRKFVSGRCGGRRRRQATRALSRTVQAGRASGSEDRWALIEVEIEGMTIRIGRGAESEDDCGCHSCFEGGHVIGPTGSVRVIGATKPVDFRKGAEGWQLWSASR